MNLMTHYSEDWRNMNPRLNSSFAFIFDHLLCKDETVTLLLQKQVVFSSTED
jgi:hypothetical protein